MNNSDATEKENFKVGCEKFKLAGEIFDQAEGYYHGIEGKQQDYGEAHKLYERAAFLGYGEAYRKLGSMYELGEGVKRDYKLALIHYKEAVKCGDIKANAPMALLLSIPVTEIYNYENAILCWNRYFLYIKENGIDELDPFYMFDYLLQLVKKSVPIQFTEVLSLFKNEILDNIEQRIKYQIVNDPELVVKTKGVKDLVEHNFKLK
ncbi:tetratricopeptide repeat protein [Peribacillus sp. SCS-26]|uniref:tetratricopeptide repeat protein n=1 Tax=Paraperibacillus marinus TaxID=3115295 RepID=UPI003906B54D